VKLDTQQLRYNVINKLTDLFNAASGMAKSRGLDVKDRQEWTRIAGYIAQMIESISKGYDEKQIDSDLASLKKMIAEAKTKRKDGVAPKGTASSRTAFDKGVIRMITSFLKLAMCRIPFLRLFSRVTSIPA